MCHTDRRIPLVEQHSANPVLFLKKYEILHINGTPGATNSLKFTSLLAKIYERSLLVTKLLEFFN